MGPTQITAVIVRLVAITFIWIAINQIAELGRDISVYDKKVSLVFIAFLLATAVFLWKFPLSVARTVIRTDLASSSNQRLQLDELYCVGFVLIGVFFFIQAFENFFFWINILILLSRDTTGEAPFDMVDKAAIVATFFQLLFSLSLIIGARGWKNLIYKIRFDKAS